MATQLPLPVSEGWPKRWRLPRNAMTAFRSARLAKNVEARFRFLIDDPASTSPVPRDAAVKLEFCDEGVDRRICALDLPRTCLPAHKSNMMPACWKSS